MFSGLMLNTWEVATIVAIVAGIVGFFVVMRGASFIAHAVPNSAFAGGAGASLIGANVLVGLGLFALLSALGIGWLSRRGRYDVVIALVVALMLGLGALFLSWSTQYSAGVYSLLFGEVLGVSKSQIGLTALLGAVAICAIAVLYRPLLLSSVSVEIARARGIRTYPLDMLFLVIVAVTATMSVPVVGALLMFTLMVGPPAAARCFASRPPVVMALSILIALITIWAAIALAYVFNWPIGFFVGTVGAVAFLVGRAYAAWHTSRARAWPVRRA